MHWGYTAFETNRPDVPESLSPPCPSYDEKASLFIPNAPIATGREDIRKTWAQLFGVPGFALATKTAKVDVARSGDLAYAQGTYVFTANDAKGAPTKGRGKFVVVWKKQTDGSWKAMADIFNSGLPPAPGPKQIELHPTVKSEMRVCLQSLILVATVPFANGQALFTGENSGKGVSSVFIAANASFVRNFTTPSNFWTAYTRGVHDRVDAFAFYGNLTIFGQTQHYLGVGSNLGILKRAHHGVDLAFLNFYSTPLNRRDQAATVSATFAPVASRRVRLRGYEMTLYAGYLRSESFGHRADKLFSPPKGTHNGIIGTVFPISKSLSLIAEYDPGRSQHNLGLALLYLLPRR